MKNRSIPWQALKFLFWAGPMLLLASLATGFVTGAWNPVALGLLIGGGVICLLWLIFQGGDLPRFWGQRSTQAGGNALVATLAVLIILGLLNFLAVRYDVRLDLTENQLFTLSPESQQVVKNLKEPAKIVVFSPQGQFAPQNRQLLENFQRQNPNKFRFELLDPAANPLQAKAFGVKDYGDVFLEAGQRKQFIHSTKITPLSESKVTNALARLSGGTQARVYFLQGHGERPLEAGQDGFSQAVQGLESKNFQSQPLNLAQTGKVPADAALVVVAGPQRPLLDGEVKILQTYLQQGGSLLLMLDPNTDPGLDSLLKEWGVTLNNAIAVDASGSGQLVGLNPLAPLVTRYGNSPITQDFRNDISFYPLARPLEIATVAGVQATPLLLTNEQSWAEVDTDLQQQQLQFNPDRDRRGPLTLGAALSRIISTATPSPTPQAKTPGTPSPTPPVSPTPTQRESRLVVIGNSRFATDGLFERQLNGDVFLNSVTWLSQQPGETLSIRPKEVANRRLTITPEQARVLSLLALGVLPLLAFGTGTLLWWQRR